MGQAVPRIILCANHFCVVILFRSSEMFNGGWRAVGVFGNHFMSTLSLGMSGQVALVVELGF